MTEEFHRIKRLPPYVFEEVNRLKGQARAKGANIIDFGMGNPDMPTPDHIVEKLIETVRKPRTNRYSASKGIPGLRRAQAGFCQKPGQRHTAALHQEHHVPGQFLWIGNLIISSVIFLIVGYFFLHFFLSKFDFAKSDHLGVTLSEFVRICY